MRLNTFNFWVDLASFVAFLCLLVTGLVIYYVLPPCGECTGAGCAAEEASSLWGLGRHDYGRIHFFFALATVTLVVVHVCLHWTWACRTFCRLVGLNTASEQRCRAYGTALLILLVALVIGLLCLAKMQVR